MNKFIESITSTDSDVRNLSILKIADGFSASELVSALDELDNFRKISSNLYEKVRSSIFLYYSYRFILPKFETYKKSGTVPYEGYSKLLTREFEESIRSFRDELKKGNYNSTLLSALAEAYHKLTFETLAEQVKKSVKSVKGNEWMFRVGHPDSHPLRIKPELLSRESKDSLYPVLIEETAVRMDLTHSCWSDIFFLGMDYPEGARVINVSIDLGVFNRDTEIKPPITSYLRIIEEPVLRLTSLDLGETKDVTELSDLFNFGNDYLSLLKAAVISSGLIPPTFEGTNHNLSDILAKIIGRGLGIELLTKVNDIPKGSRLAVSTNLLASMISLIMRGTGQIKNLTGELSEGERRVIAGRAILGEWLGGSGGGWQDSGGIWPGIKSIEGMLSYPNDPEFGVSRGCLLPIHKQINLNTKEIQFEKEITGSLILLHGGMASNVATILEMVTEKYLLRFEDAWEARKKANLYFDKIREAIENVDIKKLAQLTTINFDEPIKTIIPWATNYYTELLIQKAAKEFGENYHGFLMLGGMSGGGMGIFVDKTILAEAKEKLLLILKETKNELEGCLPFAMEPVVYNFSINKKGSYSKILYENHAIMPDKYYLIMLPKLAKLPATKISELRKIEIDHATNNYSSSSSSFELLRTMIESIFTHKMKIDATNKNRYDIETESIKSSNGFDYVYHEQLRDDLIKGRIGLSRNRLPAETVIEDVRSEEINELETLRENNSSASHKFKISNVGIICLAAGVGSRWTNGAGVIKAINPFIEIKGLHRSFLELHIQKAKLLCKKYGSSPQFVITTSYLTDSLIRSQLTSKNNYGFAGDIIISEGKSIGQKFIPMERDLRFLWEQMPQEQLDENKQKVRSALRNALIDWAKTKGEGKDYSDNLPLQRLYPLGHWYEVPNMIRNGTLKNLLLKNPDLTDFMIHNVDTLGASIDEEIYYFHKKSNNAMTFEVIPRRIEDQGGGLAKINGKLRILEGLAQPNDECELGLSYYNSMTTWINIDKFLEIFGLTKSDLFERSSLELMEAVRNIAKKIPTYVTIKEVKFRWGHGQEDIYPVAQIEKLWSDMTILSSIQSGYILVPPLRGQQLKDPSQLDGWVADGGKQYIEELCEFE